jgi:hypothetical protein
MGFPAPVRKEAGYALYLVQIGMKAVRRNHSEEDSTKLAGFEAPIRWPVLKRRMTLG